MKPLQQIVNGVDQNANNGASPSLTVDFEGASTVELPPPNGEYDFTVLRFNHLASKATETVNGQEVHSLARYIDAQLQLDSEPALGRQLFNKFLTIFKDGVTVVGTAQATAKGWSMPNLALAIVSACGLPANTLREMGDVKGVVGTKLRGKFRAKKDRDGEMRLELIKVLGKATGAAATVSGAKPAAAASQESF